MYIRRKVFSSFIDENGEERYFSTTEFEDERLYSYIDAEGNLRSSADDRIVKTAKEMGETKGMKAPKGYKSGTGGSERGYHDVTKKEMAANKKAAGVAKKSVDKNWNKSEAYKAEKKAATEALKEKKIRLEPYTNKIKKLQKNNKRLAIGAAGAGAAAIGAGTYAALKGRKKAEVED